MAKTGKTYLRNHCSCPYCGKRIEVVIRPETQWGTQVWVRKSKAEGRTI